MKLFLTAISAVIGISGPLVAQNVGINNNTPTAPLTFANATGTKISFTGASGGTDVGIGLSTSGSSAMQFFQNTSGKDFLFGFGSNNSFTTGVRMIASGFLGVGLGSISPSGKVDMGSTDGNNLVLRNLNTLQVSSGNHMYYKNGNYWTAKISAIGTSGTNARLGFFTGSGTNPSAPQERLTIDSAGRVGINNTIPNHYLHITGDQEQSPLIRLENANVLAPDISSEIYFSTSNKFTGAIKSIGTGANAARLSIFTYTGSNAADLKERLTILDNGNVGIGTLTPSTWLHVGGKIRIVDGNEDVGFQLVSDATGLATWRSGAYGAASITSPEAAISGTFVDGPFYPATGLVEVTDINGRFNVGTAQYLVPETGVYEIYYRCPIRCLTDVAGTSCNISFSYQAEIRKNGNPLFKMPGDYSYECADGVLTELSPVIQQIISLSTGDVLTFGYANRDLYSNGFNAGYPASLRWAAPLNITIKKL
jgi:hypothetical protein